MVWTKIKDCGTMGGTKLPPWGIFYIELPQDKARLWFYNKHMERCPSMHHVRAVVQISGSKNIRLLKRRRNTKETGIGHAELLERIRLISKNTWIIILFLFCVKIGLTKSFLSVLCQETQTQIQDQNQGQLKDQSKKRGRGKNEILKSRSSFYR